MLQESVRVVRQKRRRFSTSLVVLGCVLSIPLVVSAAQELALSLEETVRRADAIVVRHGHRPPVPLGGPVQAIHRHRLHVVGRESTSTRRKTVIRLPTASS